MGGSRGAFDESPHCTLGKVVDMCFGSCKNAINLKDLGKRNLCSGISLRKVKEKLCRRK